MKKRIFLIAAITALTTGCGGTMQPVVERPEAVKTDSEKIESIQLESRISAGNIDLEVYKDSANPDLADVVELTELTMKQYDAIRDRDKQAYLDTLNLSGLIDQEDYFKVVSENDPSIRIMRGFIYRLPFILTGLRENPAFDITDKAKAEQSYEMICRTVNGLSPDNAGQLLESEKSAFVRLANDNGESIPTDFVSEKDKYTIDESAYVNFLVDAANKKDKSPFLKTEITVYCGDYSYAFDAFVWKSGEEKGSYIYNMEISDNPFAGMTIEEMRTAKEEQKAHNDEITQANTRTLAADSAVMRYLKKKNTDFKTALENGDFAMAASPEGLDLSGEKPKADGDKALFNAGYKAYGVPKNGVIYIGERFDAEPVAEEETEDMTEAAENGTEETTAESSKKAKKDDDDDILRNWFIQWRLDEEASIIGQCPDVHDSSANGNIKWTQYYKSEVLNEAETADAPTESVNEAETADVPTENVTKAAE